MTNTEPNSSDTSKNTTEFVKEEFVQNYLQYRWLDETRSKLIDRFYIITAALIIARLQFNSELLTNPGWLLLIHMIFIAVSFTFAFSIVRYRRQQRGHANFIKACRNFILENKLLENNEDFENYKTYTKGKSVYLTLGVEASVVLISVLAPFVIIFDRIHLRSLIAIEWLSYFVVCMLPIIIMFLAFLLIVHPYYKYNFKKTLDWNND